MNPELRPHILVCDAIALLFQPYAEVVLHDLATETVVHISGNFSKREIGEPSLLSEIGFKEADGIIGPYEKVNWDGRPIKAISAVLRDRMGKAIGVLCINADVSDFHAALRTLNAFVGVPASDKPESLFKEDWHERVNEYVQQWTATRGLTISTMSRTDKQALVIALSSDGAFGGKNAASYISRILGMGRATVYKYLSKDSAQ
ncbi:PAS domain-containing protein [Ensifer sesbaniae]|uniref:helix-turn-helix transcriptional regulator n=1 Tax=Ensifer sesbaniae TaxID=1214071 RepID=UPI0015688955|nr:PAS domain-containing protein [Ensifer sesbaniae]MCK3776931.1 PAS domain-containing protein [Ensifer sesbaniae]NRQ17028.1 Transcriptional regulator DauR [Ensifer sesbaniae]